MQDLQLPTLNEAIAIIVSVILGTSMFLGYIAIYKKQRLNKGRIAIILLMNTGITFVVSEAMKLWDFGGYRTVFLPLVAYAGQYVFNWFDKRNEKVFDSLAGKVGVDTKDNIEQENNTKDEELEGYID